MNKLFIILFMLPYFKTEAQSSVLNIADSLFVNGNYTKAIEIYKTLKNQPNTYDKLAKAYVAIGNYDEALKNYKSSIETNPEDALAQYDYAKLLSKTKKYSEAATVFRNLLVVDSLNPNYHYELGLVLEEQHDSLDIYEYQKTFHLDQSHQKTIYKIAKYFLQKRKHDSAQKYVDIGLKSYKNNVELISLKAQNYYWQHYYREAIPWFEKLIELGESSQFIHEKLSYCYAENFEYKKAIKQGEKVLDFDPENPNNLYFQGALYENLLDYKNAEKYTRKAIELEDVTLDKAYAKLARLLNHQKKYPEAIEALQKSLKENPDNINAAFILVYTKDEYYKDIDTRIKLYEDFKSRHPDSFYNKMVDLRISELKQEKFMKAD